jgi:TIR domain-containing protein
MVVRPKPTDTNFDLISITKVGILELETQKKDKQKTKTIEDSFRHNDELIFISYAKEDYDYANKLYNDLKKANLNPWIDKENILPEQKWEKEVRKAIKNSQFFLPLFSSTSITKRGYVQREFKLAIGVAKEIPEDRIFIIPLRLDNCQIPIKELLDIQYQDMYPNWDKSVERLIKIIKIQHLPIHFPPNK